QRKAHVLPLLFFYGFLIPARGLVAMAQGFLAPAMVLALTILMIYVTMRRRIPWTMVAVGLAGFCVIQPVKASLRTQVWTRGVSNREQSDVDKLKALSSTFQLGAALLDTIDVRVIVSLAVDRLSQLVMLEKVVSYTPDEVPYWEGRTYYPLLFKVIPR